MPASRQGAEVGVHGVLMLSALVACSESPLQEGTADLCDVVPATPAAQPQVRSRLPQWEDPAAVGQAVSQPVVEALLAGEEYAVPDPVTGTTRTVRHKQVQLDVSGQPDRVYPTSPSEGWVLVLARDHLEGPDVMLGYRLFWDATQNTLNGDVGAFVVRETVIVQVGDEAPRMTWTKDGEFWEMRPLR